MCLSARSDCCVFACVQVAERKRAKDAQKREELEEELRLEQRLKKEQDLLRQRADKERRKEKGIRDDDSRLRVGGGSDEDNDAGPSHARVRQHQSPSAKCVF